MRDHERRGPERTLGIVTSLARIALPLENNGTFSRGTVNQVTFAGDVFTPANAAVRVEDRRARRKDGRAGAKLQCLQCLAARLCR